MTADSRSGTTRPRDLAGLFLFPLTSSLRLVIILGMTTNDSGLKALPLAADLMAELKVQAAKERKTMRELAEGLLWAYLAEKQAVLARGEKP